MSLCEKLQSFVDTAFRTNSSVWIGRKKITSFQCKDLEGGKKVEITTRFVEPEQTFYITENGASFVRSRVLWETIIVQNVAHAVVLEVTPRDGKATILKVYDENQ